MDDEDGQGTQPTDQGQKFHVNESSFYVQNFVDTLPRAPTLLKILNWPTDIYRQSAVNYITLELRKLGRSMTPEEEEAMRPVTAMVARNVSWSDPIAMVGSAILAWRGRKIYRFPFYTPRPTFNPNVFPSTTMPIFKDRLALVSWNSVRWMAYLGCFLIPIGTINTNFQHERANAIKQQTPALQFLLEDQRG